MSKESVQVCSECGARLAEDAEICDLCGRPVDEEATTMVAEPPVPVEIEAAAEAAAAEPDIASRSIAADRPATPSGVYCNQCGWRNPIGARYCSMCGTRIQDIPLAPETPRQTSSQPQTVAVRQAALEPPETTVATGPTDPDAADAERQAVTRQVGIIVGAGVLLVVVLFLITAISKDQSSAPATTAVTTPPPTPPMDTGTTTPLPTQLAEQA
ncbi:MAG TPA: zinc ribbon domain-containing protein, partial [Rhodothermales bacterium]|nr:zinc ribbon domain-containing protein [Rhodothermales bacterium]